LDQPKGRNALPLINAALPRDENPLPFLEGREIGEDAVQVALRSARKQNEGVINRRRRLSHSLVIPSEQLETRARAVIFPRERLGQLAGSLYGLGESAAQPEGQAGKIGHASPPIPRIRQGFQLTQEKAESAVECLDWHPVRGEIREDGGLVIAQRHRFKPTMTFGVWVGKLLHGVWLLHVALHGFDNRAGQRRRAMGARTCGA
jgi:hypothetical protein